MITYIKRENFYFIVSEKFIKRRQIKREERGKYTVGKNESTLFVSSSKVKKGKGRGSNNARISRSLIRSVSGRGNG
jgi:hypothetical protein